MSMFRHLIVQSNCCGASLRHVFSITVALVLTVGGPVCQASASDSEIRKSDKVTAADRNFWSFTKPVRPEVPEVKDSSRVQSVIDRFILSKLEEEGLGFHEEADNRTLIRRVTYNMTGLPPEPEAVEAFANAQDPEAYDQLVDRLLASPRYGERWGRHWLDVAGYAESSYFIGDIIRPDYWRYRDYVIRAFNEDKPYDVFVREQLAGDEMFDWRNAEVFTEDQIEKLVATGFLRTTPDATVPTQTSTQFEKISAVQQAVVEVSMKALMGLTLNCVRCHSHKYDPIPHEDYYKLSALFEPAFDADPERWLAGIWRRDTPGPIRAIPLTPKAERDAYLEQSAVWMDESAALKQQLRYGLPRRWRNQFLRENSEKIQDDTRRERVLEIISQGQDNIYEVEEAILVETFQELGGTGQDQLKELYPEYEQQDKQLNERLEEIYEEAALPPIAWGTFDVTTSPSPTPLLLRGNFKTPGDPVTPGVLRVLDDPEHPFDWEGASAKSPQGTTGRRLALAEWLTDPKHPLTARVMVNRIWQYHFGEGLVRTPDDFGERGSRPTHPDLLDWLAVEFMESGWSIKHIHRLILRSTAYRQSSRFDQTREEADPSNKLLNRFSKHRLEAESIRDAMLAVSGQLDLTMYGESVPTERLEDGLVVVPKDHPGRTRRSVYIITHRSGTPNILTTFDAPIMDTNAPKRRESAISQQALAAMNHPFMHESAEALRERIESEGHATFEERLNRIWMLAYSRYPTDEETSSLRAWMQSEMDASNPEIGQSDDVWQTLCHAVLSSNEFLYLN